MRWQIKDFVNDCCSYQWNRLLTGRKHQKRISRLFTWNEKLYSIFEILFDCIETVANIWLLFCDHIVCVYGYIPFRRYFPAIFLMLTYQCKNWNYDEQVMFAMCNMKSNMGEWGKVMTTVVNSLTHSILLLLLVAFVCILNAYNHTKIDTFLCIYWSFWKENGITKQATNNNNVLVVWSIFSQIILEIALSIGIPNPSFFQSAKFHFFIFFPFSFPSSTSVAPHILLFTIVI